jgi:GNAT superfamily N-acetyltransferase
MIQSASSQELTFRTVFDPDRDAVEALHMCLRRNNIAIAHTDEAHDLAVFIYSAGGELMGGIAGNLWGECLEIDYLWVHGDLRGQGYGTRLLHTIEDEARERGARVATLNTYSFQAPAFYEKLGYIIFGTVEGYGPGHKKHFLKKALT